MSKTRPIREPILKLREGEVYLYTADYPEGCKGCRYKVLKLVEYVPVGQFLVCVECLEGPDQGKWFCCSEANFAHHYEPLPPDPPPQEKVAGAVHTGKGV